MSESGASRSSAAPHTSDQTRPRLASPADNDHPTVAVAAVHALPALTPSIVGPIVTTVSRSEIRQEASPLSYPPAPAPAPAPAVLPPVAAAVTPPPAPSPLASNIDPSLTTPQQPSSTGPPSVSNVPPSSPTSSTPRPIRKRNRKALSCKPCRNMKVKCDRSMPCDRCIKNNRINDCTYDGEPDSKKACLNGVGDGYPAPIIQSTGEQYESKLPLPLPSDDFVARHTGPVPTKPTTTSEEFSKYVRKVGTAITHYKAGKARYVGGSHWVHLFGEFEEVGPWYLRRLDDFSSSRREIKHIKKMFKSKSRQNFPFCPATPIEQSKLPSLVPPRHLAETYIQRYMETFELSHPMYHQPTFQEELARFWQDGKSVSTAWLAGLFMMMFLGCWFMPLSQETERQREVLDQLLDGAQACMLSANFRGKSTVPVVRAYCMVILAKQCDALAHDDSNVASVTMAMITQMALLGGLHRSPEHYKGMPSLERYLRRKLWNTVVYMNFQNSMDGGLPFFLTPNVYDCGAPLNENEIDAAHDEPLIHPSGAVTDSTHQIILATVVAIGSEIVAPMNNADAEILAYDVVMKYDYRLTRILEDLPRTMDPAKYVGPRQDFRQRLAVQKQMIEFFIRSVLLVLHRPYAQGSESKDQYPNSYFKALHHSVEFITARKRLCSDGTANSVNGLWIAEIFKELFTTAFLIAYGDVRRRENLDFLQDGLNGYSDDSYKAIMDGQEMGESEATISEHHLQLYFATALKFPSLYAAKEGKAVVFSDKYIHDLNAAILGAAQKVREKLKIGPPPEGNGYTVITGGSSTWGPRQAENSEKTKDVPMEHASEPSGPLETEYSEQEPWRMYGMPQEVFEAMMKDPNIMLDDFFTAFLFGGQA